MHRNYRDVSPVEGIFYIANGLRQAQPDISDKAQPDISDMAQPYFNQLLSCILIVTRGG